MSPAAKEVFGKFGRKFFVLFSNDNSDSEIFPRNHWHELPFQLFELVTKIKEP